MPKTIDSSSQKTSTQSQWQHRHVLDAHDLSKTDIEAVFARARSFAHIFDSPEKALQNLHGRVVANLFYENSTRTRGSFELAAKYLGAHVLNFDVATSSVKKGETLDDTILTLQAMGVDAIVLRHASSGIVSQLAHRYGEKLTFLNAGDGGHQHPSQGLLDAFTIQEKLGLVAGLKVVIVGDIRHSRVARSNIAILQTLGADVHVVGPAALLSKELPCATHTNLDEALQDADVVMALRIQLERQDTNVQYLSSLSEYTRFYGVTRERLVYFCKPTVKVMHPMPINRDVEMTSDLADDPQYSLLFDQVRYGVLIRMALLSLLLERRGVA